MIKKFLAIILLIIYAPAELTRVIVDWANKYGWDAMLILEIPFIWVCYIGAMIIVWRLNNA